jgi:signal peptidase II
MNRFFKMLVMIASIIIIDQITKAIIQQKFFLGESIPIIKGIFNFTYVRNPGAAWGMFGHSADIIRIPLFFIVPVIASFALLYAVWTTRNSKLIPCIAYSLIFAGAVGNLIDRFSMNYVVDFLDFYWKASHFPAFNVADSSITIGAIFLGIDVLIFERKKAV